MASEHFSLCWDNFHKNMSTGMQSLLETEDLVDVTLAVEGRYLKAHKMLLSVCSPYFRQLFQSNPCQHPIVFMKDVSYVALTDLLQFMYQGEVQVAQENLSMFIKTAEALQIKGLTPENKVQIESETDQQIEKPVEEATEKRSHDSNEQKTCDSSQSKALLGPTSKRPKYCNFTTISTPASDSTQTATAENKYELSSVNTYNVVPCDEVNLKLEPIQTDTADECQLEQYDDETNVFKMDNEMEDFSLMESENDEPNPGTSTEDGDNQGSLGGHNTFDTDNDIYVGRKFSSYDELAKFVIKYEISNKQKFYKKRSRTIETASKSMQRVLKKCLKYYELEFECIHGKERPKRGNGLRQTSTLRLGCKAHFKVRICTTGEYLAVYSANLNHTRHELSKHVFEHLRKKTCVK